MTGMVLVPIVWLLFPGVATYWFATPQGLARREEALRSEGAEIVLPTTTRAPRDAVSQLSPSTSTRTAVFHLSLEDAEETTQSLHPSPHVAQQTE
jgi:hypothetical protein